MTSAGSREEERTGEGAKFGTEADVDVWEAGLVVELRVVNGRVVESHGLTLTACIAHMPKAADLGSRSSTTLCANVGEDHQSFPFPRTGGLQQQRQGQRHGAATPPVCAHLELLLSLSSLAAVLLCDMCVCFLCLCLLSPLLAQSIIRYWADWTAPRPESYREDADLAHNVTGTASPNNPAAAGLYRELASGAESGWDYSSRWFADNATLATIRTTQVCVYLTNLLAHNPHCLHSSIEPVWYHRLARSDRGGSNALCVQKRLLARQQRPIRSTIASGTPSTGLCS